MGIFRTRSFPFVVHQEKVAFLSDTHCRLVRSTCQWRTDRCLHHRSIDHPFRLDMALAKRVKYPTVIERYFTKYYRCNVHNEPNNDTLVLVHSNRVCVLMLSERHPIIEQALTIESIELLSTVNQLMSGKSKRGADYVQPNKLLYRIRCANERPFTICAGIKGRLIEINERLIEQPNLLKDRTQGHGYLAIFISSLKDAEHNLQSLCTEHDYLQEKDKR
jgi:hypothetical protein